MISAALDANIIVSGTLVEQGIPNRILRAARERRFALVTSTVIVTEVVRTLSHPRIQRKYRVAATDIERVRTLLERVATVTPITVPVSGAATHPEDDLILATAVSGGVDYLVTGDRRLLAIGAFRGVSIVSPRAFLDVLDRDATSLGPPA